MAAVRFNNAYGQQADALDLLDGRVEIRRSQFFPSHCLITSTVRLGCGLRGLGHYLV